MMAIWLNTDPREYFNKRGEIVVLVDGSTAQRARVETKHSWSVSFAKPTGAGSDFPNRWVTADDPWPDNWVWTQVPK